jgi:hypothetical protein
MTDDKPKQPDEESVQQATELSLRSAVDLAESAGVPLADANYKLLEQAAAEAAKEGRGHALAELARRAKAMREAAWAIPDDDEPES